MNRARGRGNPADFPAASDLYEPKIMNHIYQKPKIPMEDSLYGRPYLPVVVSIYI